MIATKTNNKRIWIKILIVILLLQAILELIIGLTILIDFPSTLKNNFGISYTPDLDILGVALGLYLLLLAAIMFASAVWLNARNNAGITLSIIIGLFLFAFGMLAFIRTGDMQAILVDCIRGALTFTLAFMARK